MEEYVILSEAEVEKYRKQFWFKDEVCKQTTESGKAYYLFPRKRLKDKPSLIEELIADFEWEKVERIMSELHWTWWGRDEPPTIDEMQKVVRDLYSAIKNRVEAGEYAFCATGGFKLTFNPDEDDELTLVFEAVTASVYK
jgi:hypothetical protein